MSVITNPLSSMNWLVFLTVEASAETREKLCKFLARCEVAGLGHFAHTDRTLPEWVQESCATLKLVRGAAISPAQSAASVITQNV